MRILTLGRNQRSVRLRLPGWAVTPVLWVFLRTTTRKGVVSQELWVDGKRVL